MRALEFITEIKRMDDFQYTGGKQALRVGLAKKDFQKLPGNNDLMYSTEINRDENGIIIKLWDSTKQMPKPVKISGEDRYDFAWRLKDWARTQNEGIPGLLIGKLVLEDVKHFPIKGAVQVDTITVDEDYRKQGIAKSLYGVALSILRRPLLAGSMQTSGGRRNWMSLAAIPGVEVKGYIEIPQARFKNPNSDQDIDVIMGSLGGQYIGKSRSVYYFAFDVLPGSGELTPAVKTSLNQLYGFSEFSNKFQAGMYATWSSTVTESGVKPGVAEAREKFNTDLMEPGFEFTQKIISNTIEIRNGKEVKVPVTITYKVITSELGQPMVTALDPKGKRIGHAVFWRHQTRSGLESISTEVDDNWQGLGIAANMYAVVRMLGGNINPSLFQTKQGKNMWKKWQQQGDIAQLKSMNAKVKDPLKELFAPGSNDEDSNDPYQYPKPEHYARSIDFFGQFEAEHFDKEDMNDATGEFKGYWDYDGKLRQIAYFKFDNPKRTGSNHPGMGWYYEPQNEDVAGSSLTEFAPGGQGGGDSGRWYTDDELADIIGDDWFEDFDVSHDEFNIDAYGEKAKQNLVSYANTWFDDKGYNVNVLGVEHNDVDHDLKWYIVGSFHNPGFANKGVAEGKITLSTDPNWYGATVDNYQATGPVVNIPANQLVGFEPDDKMNQPKSKVNVEKIVAGLKQGAKLPPLLVRKYKNGYQVLDGHHRFWAYKLLGVKSIPAQIVPDSDIEEISKQGVAENFADGKKPGRKGLAKRVGVDCKQPISKLRSIASNSSGERQRMAHWCANMKSGKKK